jgi:hypothetical protein
LKHAIEVRPLKRQPDHWRAASANQKQRPSGEVADLESVRRRGVLLVDIAAFIANYTAADEPRIRFDWNGKHGDDCVDRNMDFRDEVREAVVQDIAAAPLALIRDLFRAETQFSREAWCIAEDVGVLAESLLRRGGVDYLDDFLEGKFQSFDASLGSSFEYDLPLAQAMLAEVRERLTSSPDSPQAELWRSGEELFAGWVAACGKKQT